MNIISSSLSFLVLLLWAKPFQTFRIKLKEVCICLKEKMEHVMVMHINRVISIFSKHTQFPIFYWNIILSEKSYSPLQILQFFFVIKHLHASLYFELLQWDKNQYINFIWPYSILQDAARIYLLNSTGCYIWVKGWSTSSLSESISLLLLSNLFHELCSKSTLSSALVNLNHLNGILKRHFEFFLLLPKYIINWSWHETRSENL